MPTTPLPKLSPNNRRWLVVMAKAPGAGRVKTRLARQVGTATATNFYRQTSAAVITRLAATRRWQLVLAVTPDTAVHDRAWPHRYPRIGQGTGDLGARMQHAIDAMPPGPVIVVGTDIPAITSGHIARAFAALGDHDAVFGPATDGGYWLVGMARRKPLRGAFADVRWSSPFALADTMANLAGTPLATIDRLADVDDAEQLHAAGRTIGRRVLPANDTF